MNRTKRLHVLIALLLGVGMLSVTSLSADADPGPLTVASVSDGDNSAHAARLIDGATGTDDQSAWTNPKPWNADAYPMTAVIDLGAEYDLSSIEYFVGNISQGRDKLNVEVSTQSGAGPFQTVAVVASAHQWNAWRSVDLTGSTARWVQLRFDDRSERFHITELRVEGAPTTTVTTPTVPPTPTTSPTTSSTTSPTTTTTTTVTTTTTLPIVPPGDQPRLDPPGPDIVRAFGFGNWPSDHLGAACIERHDRYWTQGPEAGQSGDPGHPDNRAYHTWHPALDAGCDYGHEHGYDPSVSPVFDRSSGWPAFGYAAAQAGGQRHEDHVGHKVTVAHFRASIGNGAGNQTLYDAGFECDWLSKIHQGSHSLDAYSNHLHEYFLTLRCMDGLNAEGAVDNTVVGTDFSVKLMYTFGEPDKFVEESCTSNKDWTSEDETLFDSSLLTGPEGQSVPMAHRLTPLGNNSPNSRALNCASGVMWKDLDTEVPNVDLWTEFIKIQHPDGSTALTIQPYYIVKNPARTIEPYNGNAGELPSRVIRTIDICYGTSGQNLGLPFCADAPAAKPAWDSTATPFNGALRAVHFKASDLRNGGRATEFCTDAFGQQTEDAPPCAQGNILQQAASFSNHWNDGRYSYRGRSGNVAGSIWAEDPRGRRFSAAPSGVGYEPNGIGFEFVVDNRDPDDDFDGLSDGANLRGRN